MHSIVASKGERNDNQPWDNLDHDMRFHLLDQVYFLIINTDLSGSGLTASAH